MVRRSRKILLFAIASTFIFTYFNFILPLYLPFLGIADVDYIYQGQYSGNYLATDGWGNVLIVDTEGTPLWRTEVPEFFVHDADILPNGNVIVADTGGDRVLEIDIDDPNKVVWSWDAKDINDVNWTKVAIERGWSDRSYIENQYPPTGYWTHLNDVEFIEGAKYGRSCDSIMISLRNFDLVIEVSHDEAKDIIWWYGEAGNHDLLHRQHNPHRLDDGNTIICDSENKRIIEVDLETKEVVWNFSLEFPYGTLRWPRDCDPFGDGKLLLTDSGNSRIMVIDKESKEIELEIKSMFINIPYEADFVDGTIVIGNTNGNSVLIFDYETGMLTGIIGFPFLLMSPIIFLFFILAYFAIKGFKSYQNCEAQGFKYKLKSFQVYRWFVFAIVMTLLLVFFNPIWGCLWEFQLHQFVENIPILF